MNELMKKTPRRHAKITTSVAGLWQMRRNEVEVGYTSLATGMVVFATYYRKRGSASYIVREWLLWEGERERETPVTSSISHWNREWSCIWLPRRRADPTRRRVLSLSSARVHAKTRSFALEQQGRVIDEWRSGSGSFAFAGQPAVDHPGPSSISLACFKQEE